MAPTAYETIILENLSQAFERPIPDLERSTGGRWEEGALAFRAFGQRCCVAPDRVTLSGDESADPRAVLISLYVRCAGADPIQLMPFQAFKDFQGSMPYQGAFSANSEQALIPHVLQIREASQNIKERFGGADGGVGDFSMILYPLPKIALCCICYLPDEEFPAAAAVLFSANARSFMPLDGLADAAEYTSKEIIHIVGG